MAIVMLLIPASSYSLPYQSPRTQNVEQTNVPDYISQAKAADFVQYSVVRDR